MRGALHMAGFQGHCCYTPIRRREGGRRMAAQRQPPSLPLLSSGLFRVRVFRSCVWRCFLWWIVVWLGVSRVVVVLSSFIFFYTILFPSSCSFFNFFPILFVCTSYHQRVRCMPLINICFCSVCSFFFFNDVRVFLHVYDSVFLSWILSWCRVVSRISVVFVATFTFHIILSSLLHLLPHTITCAVCGKSCPSRVSYHIISFI